MKKALKIVAALVLVLVLAASGTVWYFLSHLDAMAKDRIEREGTQALGVTTKVDSVGIHIWSGNLALHGLDIANPKGFSAPHFLALKSGNMDVTLSSLRQDTIDVPKLHLKGIDVNIQDTATGYNYQPILDSVKQNRGAPPPPGTPEKRLIVHDLVIENVTIHADLQSTPGPLNVISKSPVSITLPIERIQLKDVGRTGTGVGGTGVTVGELSNIVVQAVLAAAAEKGKDILPQMVLGDIQRRVGDLAGMPIEIVGKAGEAVTQIGAKAVEGATKAVVDVEKQVEKGLGDLLGGNKDKKPPPKKP